MTALANDAVDTFAGMLEKREGRTALEILKGLGMLRGEQIQAGPTNPEHLRELAGLTRQKFESNSLPVSSWRGSAEPSVAVGLVNFAHGQVW